MPQLPLSSSPYGVMAQGATCFDMTKLRSRLIGVSVITTALMANAEAIRANLVRGFANKPVIDIHSPFLRSDVTATSAA